MESSVENSATKPRAGANQIVMSGAFVGATVGIGMALIPVLVSSQPGGESGMILLAAAVLATLMFGLIGSVFGGYVGWKLSRQ